MFAGVPTLDIEDVGAPSGSTPLRQGHSKRSVVTMLQGSGARRPRVVCVCDPLSTMRLPYVHAVFVACSLTCPRARGAFVRSLVAPVVSLLACLARAGGGFVRRCWMRMGRSLRSRLVRPVMARDRGREPGPHPPAPESSRCGPPPAWTLVHDKALQAVLGRLLRVQTQGVGVVELGWMLVGLVVGRTQQRQQRQRTRWRWWRRTCPPCRRIYKAGSLRARHRGVPCVPSVRRTS
jgi:hypothetical protein